MQPIDGQTSLIGLLGDPVSHSISPIIHNAAIREMGLNWCYLALPCKEKNLGEIIKALNNIDCKGLNITIPHKQNIINYCSSISDLAKSIGAVNTLVPSNQNQWHGENTDMEGFLSPLKSNNWVGKNAIILGSGGSAKAVLRGLQSIKISTINVIGRNINKLNQFLLDIKKTEQDYNTNIADIRILTDKDSKLVQTIKHADLIVNTTPIGMYKNSLNNNAIKRIPLGSEIWESLEKKVTLYDLIYTPRPTQWLQLGNKNGHYCIDGLEMLINQGAASLKLWTGHENIPIDLMRKSAEKYLLH
tara:strand:+ start:75 stop:980 length:906 start_codon:yes stop_codon:yes gene_type:complete